MLYFVNFLPSVLLFAVRRSVYFKSFKLSKTCLPFDVSLQTPQALQNNLSVIHIQWNFTFEIKNISIRKPQQPNNKHVIYLSLGDM